MGVEVEERFGTELGGIQIFLAGGHRGTLNQTSGYVCSAYMPPGQQRACQVSCVPHGGGEMSFMVAL